MLKGSLTFVSEDLCHEGIKARLKEAPKTVEVAYFNYFRLIRPSTQACQGSNSCHKILTNREFLFIKFSWNYLKPSSNKVNPELETHP